MSNSVIQGSKEWIEMRKNYIGASDAPVIMGVSPYKTGYQLWEEKVGLSKQEEKNKGMIYGNEMEEPARRAYEKLTGNLVSPTVCFHPEKKFMMASLDGLTFDKQLAVEIKNVRAEDHEKAKNGIVPEKYFPQVQHQLAVLGINMLHYFSFRYGDCALVEVKRNDEYIDDLYKNEEKFWDYVKNFKEPEMTDKDYLLVNDPEILAIANEWKELNGKITELDKKEKLYRKMLIEKSNDRNAIIGNVKLTKSIRKGTVDYSKIIELKNIDLEQYRKEPVISWRVS